MRKPPPMLDRLLFAGSRFLWPIHNLVLLLVIGIVLGQRALADYTYALAICAPLYFLVSFSLPIFMRTEGERGIFRREFAWFRLLSVVATIPIAGMISFAAQSTQVNVLVALWIVKSGDIVFDIVPTFLSARTDDRNRGSKLFAFEAVRVFLSQCALWYALLALQKGVVAVLLLVGGVNLLVSTCVFLVIPNWLNVHAEPGIGALLRRYIQRATPMTISGALLAFLISLPRLLSEPLLGEAERAEFGLAQTIGSGVALLFNGVWLYEFQRIQHSYHAGDLRRLLMINIQLSLIFVALLMGTSVAVYVIQPTLFSLMQISAPATMLFPLLVFFLSLQHCISLHRDMLKLASHEWTEVRILVASMAAATLVHVTLVYALKASWPWSVGAMCVVAAVLQLYLSSVVLTKHVHARSSA